MSANCLSFWGTSSLKPPTEDLPLHLTGGRPSPDALGYSPKYNLLAPPMSKTRVRQARPDLGVFKLFGRTRPHTKNLGVSHSNKSACRHFSFITVHRYCAIQEHETMSAQSRTANPLADVLSSYLLSFFIPVYHVMWRNFVVVNCTELFYRCDHKYSYCSKCTEVCGVIFCRDTHWRASEREMK